MRLILVRHPAPDIDPGICYGRLDLPLRVDAADIVRQMTSQIAGLSPARVWTSPAIRCRIVAKAVASAAGVPLQHDARLQELDFGAWEGQRWDDISRASFDVWAADPYTFAPPQGEEGSMLIARVAAIHQAIMAAGEDCAIVSHGGPLKLLAAQIAGKPPDLLAPAPPVASVQVFNGLDRLMS